jgi:hypothetical protein
MGSLTRSLRNDSVEVVLDRGAGLLRKQGMQVVLALLGLKAIPQSPSVLPEANSPVSQLVIYGS